MTIVLPLEDAFEATLVQDLAANSGELVMYLSKVPNITIPAGYYLPVTIDPRKGFTKQENVEVTSIDSSDNTMTIRVGGRARPRYYGDSYTAKSHIVGARVIITDNYQVWNEVNGRLIRAGDTMTGRLQFSGTNATIKPPAFANTTARDAAITAPSDGDLCTVAGDLQHYNATTVQWETVDTGTPTPNGSDTVAGKWEGATVAEQGTQSSTGGSGAGLVLQPKNLVKTSSGSGDENKIAILGSDGKFATGFIPAVTTDAMVHSTPAGEAVDGSTTPQCVFVSDGTNSKTAGRFYKADADDYTNMALRNFGFVKTNASSVGTSYDVQYGGVVSGFTGLSAGYPYFLSTTAGSITTPAPTGSDDAAILVGIAISTTELMLVQSQSKVLFGTYSFTGSSSETVDTTISLGFYPQLIHCIYGQNSGTSPAHSQKCVSVGFWTTGMGIGDGNGAGRCMVSTGDDAAIGNMYSMLGMYEVSDSNTVERIVVQSVTRDSVTIRRVAGSTAGTPSLSVHLAIYG